MSNRHIFIGGVERFPDYEQGSLRVQPALTYQIDTASFNLRGEQPVQGEEVFIEDDLLGRLFAGIIVQVQLARTTADRRINLWKVDCDDYTAELDRKQVSEDYQNMRADQIFLNIAAKYCPGFTTNGVQSGAPMVTEIQFNYIKVSDAFKQLCDYCGWQWQPDYYKDLAFFNANSLNQPAPMALGTSGQGVLFRNLQHKIDIQNLRNRVYVKGGTMLSDPISPAYQIKADGVATAWALPYEPNNTTMKVNGVATPVGIENTDTEANFAYMVSATDKRLRCSSQTAAPAAGTVLALTFQYPIDVISQVDDLDSQMALAAAQGGDGVYEYSIEDTSLITPDAVEAAGNAQLRQFSNPVVTGSFDTEIMGWEPGQLLPIYLPSRGIDGTYLIQKVTIKTADQWKYTCHVEYGGRLYGISDILLALVNSQKQAATTPAVIKKISYMPEIMGVGDQVSATPRIPPWKCGDPDAICGFVSCG